MRWKGTSHAGRHTSARQAESTGMVATTYLGVCATRVEGSERGTVECWKESPFCRSREMSKHV